MKKIEMQLIPTLVYIDGDFSYAYNVLLSAVRTLVSCRVLDYYSFPMDITEYLVANGYATVGHMSLHTTAQTVNFLNELKSLNQ